MGYFKLGVCTNIGGLIMTLVPSMVFPAVTGVVAAGLAPIHAYWISLMVGHLVVQGSGVSSGAEDDPAVRQAAQIYETLYLGYCAASRTELCLFIGSTCMAVLLWFYIYDIFRGIAALTCHQPKYTSQGCQLCKAHRLCRSKTNQMYEKVGGQTA